MEYAEAAGACPRRQQARLGGHPERRQERRKPVPLRLQHRCYSERSRKLPECLIPPAMAETGAEKKYKKHLPHAPQKAQRRLTKNTTKSKAFFLQKVPKKQNTSKTSFCGNQLCFLWKPALLSVVLFVETRFAFRGTFCGTKKL